MQDNGTSHDKVNIWKKFFGLLQGSSVSIDNQSKRWKGLDKVWDKGQNEVKEEDSLSVVIRNHSNLWSCGLTHNETSPKSHLSRFEWDDLQVERLNCLVMNQVQFWSNPRNWKT